ncbi:MAG: lipid-A-disaccharide synthase [Sulfurovum sp.]|nr:lipid-A-disaccharide synthase [Sulfurovum sp.]MCB4745499.1 lipid-A-disaccharide synthase [Sulfurovum sp.]MCB4745605.1 lipid-A-disaccharide synthase [Sulfurovum sp.]MCB4748494.1 lipid-A-disaccharide synthase [Sulfurovum sp.]MCB4750523.1 lipid-A-disaccharide synthase [Sulfurovum sp.]
MKVLVSALEPSSNLHLHEVLKHTQGIELIGIFDKHIDQGRPLYDITEMAIMGVVDAIKKLRWFFKVIDEMVDLAKEADKILLMDSSGFNLPLAKKLKKRYPNKEIIYYILPQVWASRPKRVKKLEKYCDNLLGILPFETSCYPSGKARYIGHPLLDEITSACNPKENRGCIAFFPGSRKSEIERLMPIFLKVRKKLPNIRPLLVIPPHFSRNQIAKLYIGNRNFEIVRNTHEALMCAEFAFICSGTATLEAALMGTPFTLAYIAKRFDFFIGTKILGITQVGLANIILSHYNNTTLHKELLQEDVTVNNLLAEYYNTDQKQFAKKAKELKKYLGYGSSKNVAEILMKNEEF